MRRFSRVILISVAVISVALLVSCGDTDAPAATASIEITARAGPTCPVETDPPSPDCAARPVQTAMIVVIDPQGHEVGRGATGSDGRVIIDVPPGELTVVPQPVEGLLGTAATQAMTVADGQTLQVTADYDTGIR
jgi:hypothetical protein